MLARGGKNKIRPPRRGIASNANVDFETLWKNLSTAMMQIHTKNASVLSYESLYRDAYKLVLKKEGAALYSRLQEFEQTWLRDTVGKRILEKIPSNLSGDGTRLPEVPVSHEIKAGGEALMKGLKEAWDDHCVAMNMITDVMTYLDRVYCNENRIPGLIPMSMSIFRDDILGASYDAGSARSTISETLIRVMLHQVQLDREGYAIDKTLTHSCAIMLEGLYAVEGEDDSKLYLTLFEGRYLAESREYFRREGEALIRSVDAASWCAQATRRMNEEVDRCRSTLSTVTVQKIRNAVDEEFIKPYLPEAINMPGSGVRVMLDNDKLDSLRDVYALSRRIDSKQEVLRNAVQIRIEDLGQEINDSANAIATQPYKPANAEQGDSKDDKPKPDRPANQQTAAAIAWVEEVLKLQVKYDKILREAFDNDKALQTAFTQSFTRFINVSDRSSEYLSLFFDENMKKGIKGKTEAEVDKVLDDGIILLRYIRDKDLFERYYKKHLSRRLLMKRSVSMDAERQMIAKMKLEVGNSFTNRIEHMFKDIDLSEDLTRRYKDQISASNPERTELHIDVLTSSMWPSESIVGGTDAVHSACNFPSSIARIKSSFEKFYLDQHTGRKLTWQANMGTADIRAHFPRTKGNNKFRELNVSTYGMVILILFQDLAADETMTCEEIQAQTNIPMSDLVRNLQSLAVASKTRILMKDPMSKDVKPTDKFSFNDAFHSQFTKIKVGVVSNANRLENVDERKETEKKNNEDRGAVTDAAIVRIMKQRKTFTHQLLVNEVITQLKARFQPDVGLIKKRIENLIERDYLERVEDNERPSYNYLA